MKIPLSAKIPTKRAQQTLHFRVFRRARGECKAAVTYKRTSVREMARYFALFSPFFRALHLAGNSRAPQSRFTHASTRLKNAKKKKECYTFSKTCWKVVKLYMYSSARQEKIGQVTYENIKVTVQRLSSVKISLLATSIRFQASAKFNCIKGAELLARRDTRITLMFTCLIVSTGQLSANVVTQTTIV